MENILFHKNISKIVGVDNCENYLNFAKIRFNKVDNLEFIFSDVINVNLPTNHWDLIIMASAYHHLEDDRKAALLENVYKWLSPNGVVVMAENILPEYENTNESYQESVKYFYQEVLKTAREQNPLLPDDIAALIWRVAQHGCEGDYEYKTSLPILKQYLDNGSLKIISEERVWQGENESLSKSNGGNYVFKIKKR
jgi:ubiquinone/menaquinone biosynthesis C-methylase UbiE